MAAGVSIEPGVWRSIADVRDRAIEAFATGAELEATKTSTSNDALAGNLMSTVTQNAVSASSTSSYNSLSDFVESNCQVPPPVVPNSDYLITVISYIFSPSHFFVHLIDTSEPNGGQPPLDDLTEKLNSFYCSKEVQNCVVNYKDVIVNSFWACTYTDNDWYRVRVLKVTSPIEVRVQYIDYGNEEIVPYEQLKPLLPELATIPALAVRCSLANIFPDGDEWSEEAKERFAELSGFEKENFLTAESKLRPIQAFTYDSILDIFLWNNADTVNSKEKSKEFIINYKLVMMNLARTFGSLEGMRDAEHNQLEQTPPALATAKKESFLSQSHESSPVRSNGNVKRNDASVKPLYGGECNSLNCLDDWDPQAEDYYSVHNRYDVNTEDPTWAVTGYNAKQEKGLCKFFSKNGKCRRGDRCQFRHAEAARLGVIPDRVEDIIQGECFVDKLNVGLTLPFRVTYVETPYSFYGYFPYGITNLEELDYGIFNESSDNKRGDLEIKLHKLRIELRWVSSTALKNVCLQCCFLTEKFFKNY